MSHSWKHSGSSLPVTLTLDQREVRADCPTCERSGMDGVIAFTVSTDRAAATTPARCSKGHVVMVAWTREAPAD